MNCRDLVTRNAHLAHGARAVPRHPWAEADRAEQVLPGAMVWCERCLKTVRKLRPAAYPTMSHERVIREAAEADKAVWLLFAVPMRTTANQMPQIPHPALPALNLCLYQTAASGRRVGSDKASTARAIGRQTTQINKTPRFTFSRISDWRARATAAGISLGRSGSATASDSFCKDTKKKDYSEDT